jgi:CubicO group peptidase (beta-lactamase class C family)
MSFSGGAGLTSTARDYARFLEMLRRGGAIDGQRHLSPRSVELLSTDQVGTRYSADGGTGWGLGFATVQRTGANGFASAGSFNWGGAYASIYAVDPAERLVMVLMLQHLPGTPEARARFQTLVYQALVGGAPR